MNNSNKSIQKRMRVYLNGDLPEKAVNCWASSIEELNEAAKLKLHLTKPIKFFFSEDGKIVRNVNLNLNVIISF